MEMLVLKLWDYWALISIIFIGIPHGAFDGAISITLGYSKKLKLQLAFISMYIFIAFVVIMFWIYFPVIALILFLFLSVFHFGLGDLVWKNSKFYLLKGYFHGGLIVFGIIFLNTTEVDIIFKILSGENLALLWYALDTGFFIWVLSCFLILFFQKSIVLTKQYIGLICIILSIIILLPPLPAFALYFCLIHSWNHVSRIYPTLISYMKKRKAILLMIGFSTTSWIMGLIGYYFILETDDFSNSILKITFIGIASLTVPHMILVDGFFRPKFKI
jgi:Brp/Blh family beta-carotene 15,15'-monooxygenase|tara:strand:+ start:2919 stop:3740 length:822 start_codon:yes stop_codon:yes gene_type:complete